MKLTNRQRKRIEKLVRDHHTAFIAEVLGPDAVTQEDYARLKEAGLIKRGPMPLDAATASHMAGVVTGEVDTEAAEQIEPRTFWSMAQNAGITFDDAEREAIAIAKDKIGEDIRGLGNKIDAATGRLLVDADDKLRRKRLSALRREVSRGVEERLPVDEIVAKVRAATRDAKRNWLQIVQTEVHNAMEEGKAAALVKTLPPGSDPFVYKRPRPDACPFCRLLYLKPDGKTPRVFKLSELISNGTNVGRKAKRPTFRGIAATEWKAVLGAMHPWCACSLHYLPPGMGFNDKGLMVYVGAKKSMLLVETLDQALIHHDCAKE